MAKLPHSFLHDRAIVREARDPARHASNRLFRPTLATFKMFVQKSRNTIGRLCEEITTLGSTLLATMHVLLQLTETKREQQLFHLAIWNYCNQQNYSAKLAMAR